MTTTTKTPSAELARLQDARDKAYAAVQEVKRERAGYETETANIKAAYTAFVNERPEDWANEVRLPKPGTPSAKERDKLRERLASENPHEKKFNAAVAKFHAADDVLHEFLTGHLPDLLAEQEPAVRALEDKRTEAFEALAEVGAEYAELEAQARDWIIRTPRLNGQALKADPRPRQWAELARDNLGAPLAAPGLTGDAEWTISNG